MKPWPNWENLGQLLILNERDSLDTWRYSEKTPAWRLSAWAWSYVCIGISAFLFCFADGYSLGLMLHHVL
jgi:hypothetical protein